MTYTTTHLGISTLVIYYLLPADYRKYLMDHKLTFFLITLGAVIPDLDILTSGHRAYGHTIFAPFILFISAPLLAKLKESDDLQRNLRLFAVFWFSHLLYDTTFGALAIFWPLDPRFYDFTMGVTFNLEGNFLLPITISGLFIDISIIDQQTGIDTYFVNWTAEERLAAFGSQFINFPIQDFFIHVTLFSFYFFKILLPITVQVVMWPIRKFGMMDKLEVVTNKIYRSSEENVVVDFGSLIKRRQLLTPIVIILLSSTLFIVGPYQGAEWIDEQDDNSFLYVITDQLQLMEQKDFSVPVDSELTLEISAGPAEPPYGLFIVPISTERAGEINSNINNLLELYDSDNLTFTQLVEQYKSYVTSNITLEPANVQAINENATIRWTFRSSSDITILAGLYDWNISNSFVTQVHYKAIWNVDRGDTVRTALIWGIVTFLGAILLATYNIYRTKEEHTRRQ